MSPEAQNSRTILVVDDQPGIRRLVRRLLELDDYVVIVFGDGESAIQRLPELPPLSCALLDLTMPSMDGLTLSRALREQRQSLPIVFMSGYDRNQVLQTNMVDEGELSFLAKPFTREGLLSVISAAITSFGRFG
jgi:CheY-like chemotaxis protein